MTRSANLDFFAAGADQRAVLDFLFSSTDVRVFESYSEYGAELREFHSTDELAAAFPIGKDSHGNGYAVQLQLWSPSVMRDLTIRRFALDPAHCEGHTFRHCIEGGALMQLYLGGVCGRVVTRSHFGHQSQARARAWGWMTGSTGRRSRRCPTASSIMSAGGWRQARFRACRCCHRRLSWRGRGTLSSSPPRPRIRSSCCPRVSQVELGAAPDRGRLTAFRCILVCE